MPGSANVKWSSSMHKLFTQVGLLLIVCGTSAFAQEGAYQSVIESSVWRSYITELATHSEREVDRALLSRRCEELLAGRRLTLQQALDNCIAKTLESIDDFGSYEKPADFSRRKASGPPFVGIALELLNGKTAGEPLRVISTIANGPGARAGVHAGDEILAVDGKSLLPLDMNEALAALRGPPGSRLSLLIQRPNETLTISAVREEVSINYVRFKRYPGDILYSRISFFRDRVTESQFYTQLVANAPGDSERAFILDLRNCPGGSLDEIISVASLFTKPDTALLKRTSRARQDQLVSASRETPTSAQSAEVVDLLKKIPLYILVNGRTSVGAEALALALHKSRNAIIVGSRTAGLNFVQQRIVLEDQVAITVTTGRLLTAAGDDWRERGIPIDVRAPESEGHEFGILPGDTILAAALKKIAE